jgi:murein DD-endopeptidase MepM/ murein hydrolase activator NlpD
VRKLRATRAALIALLVVVVWPARSEGKPQKKGAHKPGASVSTPAPGKHLVSHPKKARPAKSSQRVKVAASGKHKRAKRIIHQNAGNEVVLEWIQATRRPQAYGPFLPPSALLPVAEAENEAPQEVACAPVDVVLEVHVHDESPETADAQTSEEGLGAGAEEAAARESRTETLVAIARRIGSFFRPKSSSARMSPDDVDLGDLLSANLRIPVEGVDAEKLRDSFLDRRDRYRKHLAIDIGAPRGTPIIATADGEIVRLRREKRGGIAIYQKDTTGKYLFFYCHLERYAKGLAVGQRVSAGDVIGYVGATGHVIGGPHLHFSITRVPEDDDFREGLAVNPYLLFLAGVP